MTGQAIQDKTTMSSHRICASGAGIPCIGFGTYGMRGKKLAHLAASALQAGFQHIDTAQVYGNEEDVGEGIEKSGVQRDEVFVTTKVWVTNYPSWRFEKSIDESLRLLRTDYIDLLLLHWPSNITPLEEQIGQLNDVVRAGKVLNIGVSNFNSSQLERAIELSDNPIATNQVEYHPYLNQAALVSACRGYGVALTAYCAMAVGRVFDEPILQAIAARYGKSVSQIVLRWLTQQDGVVALSKTAHAERLVENLNIFDFALQADDMNTIFGLATPASRIVDPPGLAPIWDPTPAFFADVVSSHARATL